MSKRHILSTITSKGQVTIPVEVRRHLGLAARDQVTFVIDNDQVQLRPATYSLASAFGAVTPATATADIDRLIEEAKADKAQRDLARRDR